MNESCLVELDKRTLSSTSGSPMFLAFSMKAVIDSGHPMSIKVLKSYL